MQAIQTARQYEYAREHVLALKSGGYTVELLTAQEARAIEPALNPDLFGAILMPLRAQADPVKATGAFAAAAQRLGAEVLTGREVTGLTALPDGAFRVDCQDEAHTGNALVLAAGAWCGPLGEMLGLRIPILPVRGQMWASEPLPPRVFHSISSCESPMHWKGSPGNDAGTPPELTHIRSRRVTRHLYGRQTRDGEIIFGGDRELAGYDKSVEIDGVEVNFGHVREILPMLGEHSISRTWAGLMPFLTGRETDHRPDSAAGEPVHRGRAGVVGVRSRADGREAHCRLRTLRPPYARVVGVRSRQVRGSGLRISQGTHE